MKILLYGIFHAPVKIGIGKYSGELAEWLSRQGHEVRVVTAPPFYPEWKIKENFSSILYRSEEVDGTKVWYCPLWIPGKPTGIRRILHLVSFAISSFPVMIAQIIWKPDVLISIEPPIVGAPVSLIVARISGAYSWLHVQDFEIDAAFGLGILSSPRLQRLLHSLDKRLKKGFDRVSTISAKMMENLEVLGVPDDKRFLFRNWVDIEMIRPLDRESSYRKQLLIGKENVVILYSGNMGKKQGLEVLVQAARLLRNKKNITFVMCGNGSALKELKDSAADLEDIIWLPIQPTGELNELLNLADIHILPQRKSVTDLVMPSKLTGMLASGRAIVAASIEFSEIANILKEVSRVVVPGSSSELAKAIIELVENKDERERLGRAGRIYAETYLDKQVILSQFEKELKKSLKN